MRELSQLPLDNQFIEVLHAIDILAELDDCTGNQVIRQQIADANGFDTLEVLQVYDNEEVCELAAQLLKKHQGGPFEFEEVEMNPGDSEGI